MAISQAKRIKIRAIFEKFIKDRINTIRSLQIEDLNIKQQAL
ncbi:MAG: hypothetical protein ABIL22_00890 [candidate division WOR-3 bacterium]